MRTLTWLKTISAATVAIIGLQLGGAPAQAETATINQYGYWEAVTDTATDGTTICGVRTHMTNGAELRLMVVDGKVHLVAHDPSWSMRKNAESRIVVAVDGEAYRGTAVAVDAGTLLVPSLTYDFLRQFMDGYNLETDLGGRRWSVSLVGSSRATNEMAACVKDATSALTS